MTFIDTLDVGCPACGATYTAGERHDCPGYNQWTDPIEPAWVEAGYTSSFAVYQAEGR